MTARQHITEYLSRQQGFVPSGEIHDHVCRFGLRRVSSHSSLIRMVSRGEIIRKGKGRHSYCKLKTEYESRVSLFDQLRGVRP